MPRKVKVVQVALVQQCVCQGKTRPHSHMAVADARGRLWERFSDMPPGEWGEIERPTAPARKGRGNK